MWLMFISPILFIFFGVYVVGNLIFNEFDEAKNTTIKDEEL